MPDLKIELNCDFLCKIGVNSKFRYKSSEYQNFTGFLLIQKGNGNSNMFCKFQHHSKQIFFKMANFLFSKNRKGCINPPSPSDFDGLPYPWVRWYPQFFFMKMTAKDVKGLPKCPWLGIFIYLHIEGALYVQKSVPSFWLAVFGSKIDVCWNLKKVVNSLIH